LVIRMSACLANYLINRRSGPSRGLRRAQAQCRAGPRVMRSVSVHENRVRRRD